MCTCKYKLSHLGISMEEFGKIYPSDIPKWNKKHNPILYLSIGVFQNGTLDILEIEKKLCLVSKFGKSEDIQTRYEKIKSFGINVYFVGAVVFNSIKDASHVEGLLKKIQFSYPRIIGHQNQQELIGIPVISDNSWVIDVESMTNEFLTFVINLAHKQYISPIGKYVFYDSNHVEENAIEQLIIKNPHWI